MRRSLKNRKFVLDITSVPRHMNLSQWKEACVVHGLLLWDSSLGGQPPKLLGRNVKAFKICDISKNNPRPLSKKKP